MHNLLTGIAGSFITAVSLGIPIAMSISFGMLLFANGGMAIGEAAKSVLWLSVISVIASAFLAVLCSLVAVVVGFFFKDQLKPICRFGGFVIGAGAGAILSSVLYELASEVFWHIAFAMLVLSLGFVGARSGERFSIAMREAPNHSLKLDGPDGPPT